MIFSGNFRRMNLGNLTLATEREKLIYLKILTIILQDRIKSHQKLRISLIVIILAMTTACGSVYQEYDKTQKSPEVLVENNKMACSI